jgi:stress response protein SCP2
VTNVLGAPTAVDRPTPERGVCPLAPYRPFSEPLPAVSDEAPEQLVESVLAIVAVEGPVVGSRLRSAYGRAAGHRVGPRIALALTKAIRSAVRKGRLVREDPLGRSSVLTRTYRLPEQPAVIPRELGARQFGQVPPAELAHVMSRAGASLGWADIDVVYRATMNAYGIRRMGGQVRATLQSVVGLANAGSPRMPEDPGAPSSAAPDARWLRPGEEILLDSRQITWRVRWSAGTVDVDPSVFLVDASSRVRSDEDFVFYNQPVATDESVRLTSETSESAATTERIEFDLDALAPDVARVLVSASVDTGALADVRDVVVTATTSDDGATIHLPVDGCAEAGLVFAEVSRRNSGWWLRALQRTYPGGLEEIARVMGVEVAAS